MSPSSAQKELPKTVLDAVFVPSTEIPSDAQVVRGYDFNNGIDYQALMKAYFTTGYQGTALGQAFDIVNKMLAWRLSDEPLKGDESPEDLDPEIRAQTKCKIFLGYTSNLVSSGLRESIRFLTQHKLVDCIVTSAGGVEEDFIKVLGDTYVGSFNLSGAELRKKGLNRIGNLFIANDNYCKFEDWLMPILDEMLIEQKTKVQALLDKTM